MKKLNLILMLAFFSALITSCASRKDYVRYVKDLSDSTQIKEIVYTEPLILKNDLLSIQVFSDAIDGGKTDAMYNMNISGQSTSSSATEGYLVDNEGYIEYPKIGRIKAEGLTKPQLADVIRKKVESELTNPTVLVKLMNFRITVLGEVNRPGPITLPGEKLSILEAIGLAGDVTVYAQKEEVLIFRNVDGKFEHGKIDLSSTNLFESPYYYLRQNDFLIVNNNKYKGRLSEQSFALRLGIVFGIINTAILLYTVF
jgi:polysaccharide export outer membrane protein